MDADPKPFIFLYCTLGTVPVLTGFFDLQEVLQTDENSGLVQQVVQSQTRTNIKKLTKTFVTLSLSDVGSRYSTVHWGRHAKTTIPSVAVFLIRISINADPDPGFYFGSA